MYLRYITGLNYLLSTVASLVFLSKCETWFTSYSFEKIGEPLQLPSLYKNGAKMLELFTRG